MAERQDPKGPKPYIHPYAGGMLLGCVLFLSFFISGNGLGASGGLNRIIVFFEDMIVPGHVDRTPYLLEMAGGNLNPLNAWIIPMVLGTILGGFLSGLFNRRLKVETNRGPHITDKTRWIMAFAGGAIGPTGTRRTYGAAEGDDEGPATLGDAEAVDGLGDEIEIDIRSRSINLYELALE